MFAMDKKKLKFEAIKRGDGSRFESTFILVKYIEGWFIWIHSDSWNVFQSLCSTLIISVEEMEPLPWRKDASAPVRLFHWLTLVLVVFFLTSNKGVLFPDFFLYLSPPYTVQQQLFLAEIKQRPQRQASNCSLYVQTTFPPVTDGLDWKTSHVWDTVTSAASAADLKLQMTSQRAAVHNLVRHCRRWQSTSGEIWQHYVQIMASTQTWAKAVNQCDTVNILSLQRETGRNFKTSTLLFPPPQRKHSFTWTERCD